MKKEDLRKDVVYQFHFSNKAEIYISRVVKDGHYKMLSGFIGKGRTFIKEKNHSINSGMDVCKPATPKQIAWLNACIKADKFIPLDEVVPKIDCYDMY